MKTEAEILEKLRDRIHRAQRRWFRRFPDIPKDDLLEEFKTRMRTPEILLRDYKDIVTLLWVLGEFDQRKGEATCLNELPGRTTGSTTSQKSSVEP